MGRWCDLPLDLVCEIDEELTYIEKVRVRATCEWWNSALPKVPNHKLPQLPWLLQTNVDEEGTKSHALFNICERKSYRVDLPQLEGKLLKGSSHGWLAMISVDQKKITPSSPDISLLNPLTGAQIQLPPRSTYPDVVKYDPDRFKEEYTLVPGYPQNYVEVITGLDTNHVHRGLTNQIVTSTSPCSENCVVFAIYGEFRNLAWCMPGHDKWTPINLRLDSSPVQEDQVVDVIISGNKVYCINRFGQLFQIESIGTPSPKVTPIISKQMEGLVHHMVLMECSDGRLMKVIVQICNIVAKFEAYEVDVRNKCFRLVSNIGNDMLFLGHNLTYSVPSRQFPGHRGNRVYFCDEPNLFAFHRYKKGYVNIGIFDFEDHSIERLPDFENVPRSLWPQAVWIDPSIFFIYIK